jgi:hypothetical protein
MRAHPKTAAVGLDAENKYDKAAGLRRLRDECKSWLRGWCMALSRSREREKR